ncbi:unnamed protein product [Acanthoscelides obtectus]|uniref:PiggyBac transposable element-derived protein domain-containing protein n=1 Tax=Acanthoscelides obtectus TaxID=200917 RepID=A0A9P0NZA0_ACAOB|nr:unnamed protein product [Acanthoscelides obtectus]CAK1621850.1 PiggyBac transposable element-derived protein 3 [Acanthoscelides obtectus]
MRPILEAVSQGCLQLLREKVVAVDEQMIPFTETCQMKQFVRGKPNLEGLKNFVVAAPDGLAVDFELYQGKNTFPDNSVKRLGVGPSADARLGRTLFPRTHASTGLGIQPSDKCKRWSKKDSKYIQVPRPYIVAKYNGCMGGIGLIDRMISYYRIQARSKKWTVRVIFHFFDLAMANSWIYYRRDKKISQTSTRKIQQYLDFKIEIDTHLLKNESNISQEIMRGIGTRRNPDDNIIVHSPTTGTERKRKEHYPEIASDLRNSVRCTMTVVLKNRSFFVIDVTHSYA